jgi:hypothetical protein
MPLVCKTEERESSHSRVSTISTSFGTDVDSKIAEDDPFTPLLPLSISTTPMAQNLEAGKQIA